MVPPHVIAAALGDFRGERRRVRAENRVTVCDLGVLVVEAAESV
jgi:hypothetical protein